MKKLIITEDDKTNIRKMYGLINENIEAIKDELGYDVSIPVEEYVDSEDPLCTIVL